jgi:hypothetical protein
MAKRAPAPSGPYRCEATMSDGTAAVLFASCSTPAVALWMVRDTWLGQGDKPVEIRVYAGGREKSVGSPLVRWRA